MSDAIFVGDGELLVPTAHAAGPWDPAQLHGGGPVALLARACEQLVAPAPMRLTRLGVEFLRPVPRAPLRAGAEVVRGGRRLQLLRAWLHAGDEEVLRAHATFLRVGDVALPEVAPVPAPPGPEGLAPARWAAAGEGFHLTGMEVRFAHGDWGLGPGTAWLRLTMPLVAGEAPSPTQRVAAAADFGNGVSRALDFDTHLFINPDLTLHLVRPPVGEWVALEAETDIDAAGIGQARSVLHDGAGRIGLAAQSLYVDER